MKFSTTYTEEPSAAVFEDLAALGFSHLPPTDEDEASAVDSSDAGSSETGPSSAHDGVDGQAGSEVWPSAGLTCRPT